MRIPVYTLLILSSLSLYAAEPQNGSGETDGYKLVWQDLFDAEEINPLRWNIEVNGDGGGNAELQYYTDRKENIRLGDDGKGNHCLILTARRENYKGKAFTSGRLNSKDVVIFTHGKIEASIKLPSTNAGLWPAFWMMGNDYTQVGWPRCGETDILEMGHSDGIRNGVADRYFNGACHWGQGWPNASYAKASTKSYSLQDGEFHLFTLIWDEQSYRMYVDLDRQPIQTPYFQMDIPANEPDNEWSAGNYFHKDNFILFNMAVGGNFPGIHDAAGITALSDANGNEASMYVNYVKVYQLEEGKNDSFFSAVPTDDLNPADSSAGTLADEAPDALSIRGNSIMASRPALISVFNSGGIRVASASAGNLDISALSPGIYFATALDRSLKFIIK